MKAASQPSSRPWAVPGESVLRELGTVATGLSRAEAQRRLRDEGPNELADERAVRPAAILARQFRSPLIYILVVAAAVTVALEEYVDSIVIGLVLVFNAVVGFFQEYRAERSLEALRRLATTQARVILIMFELQRGGGASLDEARSVALTTMVVFMVLHVGNSRSETLSAFAKDPFSNRFLFVGTLGAIAIHVAALYIPVTQLALDLEPIPLRTWLEIVAIAISVIVAVELHKLVRGRHPIRRSAADPSV